MISLLVISLTTNATRATLGYKPAANTPFSTAATDGDNMSSEADEAPSNSLIFMTSLALGPASCSRAVSVLVCCLAC